MTRTLSKKSECVMQSEIRTMSIECDKVGGINLSQGVCNLEVPMIVRDAARQAMDEGQNCYTRYDGIEPLRGAIAHKLARYGIAADPESEIVVCSGATGAFYCAALALLDPGDEVILFEPYYGYHLSTLQVVGAVPAFVKLSPPEWHFSEQDLEAIVKPRTKGIMICTPANPSGKVWSRSELEQILKFAEKYDLFVFTDEIYEYFVYDHKPHLPPATITGAGSRVITISGLSKTFSITGWRIGYCYCEARWARPIGYFHDLVYVCAPAPLQVGVARGMEALAEAYYDDLLKQFTLKRETICTALQEAGFSPYVPSGGYYVLADISGLPGKTSKQKAMHLLEKTKVACVPGEAFYQNPHDGDNIARFCFAKEDDELQEACRRIRRFRQPTEAR